MSPLGVQFELPFTIDGLDGGVAVRASARPLSRRDARLLRGDGDSAREGRRSTTSTAAKNGPRVAIVNETLARRYFGGAIRSTAW